MPTEERMATRFTKKSSSFSMVLSLIIGTTIFPVLIALVKVNVCTVGLGVKSVAFAAVPLFTK